MKSLGKFVCLFVVFELLWALGFHDALGQSLRIKVIAVFSQDPNDSSAEPISNLEIKIGSASVVTGSDGVGKKSVSPGSYIVKVRKELLVDNQGIEYRVGFVNVHVTKEPGAGRKCAPTSREGDVTVRFDASASNPQALSEYELAVRIVPNDAPPLQGGETDCAGPPPPICSMEVATAGGNIRASDKPCFPPPTITRIDIPAKFTINIETNWTVYYKNPGQTFKLHWTVEVKGTLSWSTILDVIDDGNGTPAGGREFVARCTSLGVIQLRITVSNVDGTSKPFPFSYQCISLAASQNKPKFTKEQKDALAKASAKLNTQGAGGAVVTIACLVITEPIVTKICAFAAGLYSGANWYLSGKFGEMVLDPPDPNFTEIVQPVIPQVPLLSSESGAPQKLADAFDALLSNQTQIIGLSGALLHAIERAQGAFDAGDVYWQGKQLTAAAQFSSQISVLLKAQTLLRSNLQKAWTEAGFNTISFSAEDVSKFQTAIAANGLPKPVTDALQRFNLDSATIDKIKQSILAEAPKAVAGSFPAKLTDPTLNSALQGVSQQISQLASKNCKTNVNAELNFIGFGEDKVGGYIHQPDGKGDGHFQLKISRPNSSNLKLLKLETADKNNRPAFGQVWDTDVNSYRLLGIQIAKGQKLNPIDKEISIPVNKTATFELFANDSGYFQTGQHFIITALFQDGCVAQASVAISQGTGTQTSLLKVDDGSYELFVGFPSGTAKAYFVNRLTPSSYPATLQNIQIHFTDRSNGLKLNDPITLLVSTNPSGNTNINNVSFQQISTTVKALNQFNQYDVSPITINSGDFVVGFITNNPAGIYPIDQDTSSPSQGRSYLSTNGTQFSVVDSVGANLAGNFAIRASVSLGGSSTSMKAEEQPDLLLLLINKLNLELRDGQLIVDAYEAEIAALQVQLFDLTGRQLLNRISNSSVLTLPATDEMGRLLPNGVYLYVVSVRDKEGILLRSSVRKLIILK